MNRNIFAVLIGLSLIFVVETCSEDSLTPSQPPWSTWPRYGYASPAWSPNNDLIAYSYNVDPYGILDTVGLYLFSLDDSGSVKHIRGNPRSPQDPEFSPNGDWIAASWYNHLWKFRVDGDSMVQLTVEGRNYFPAWSPDGKHVAFRRYASEDRIVIMNNNGGELKDIFCGTHPDWVDNKRIAYVREGILIGDIERLNEVTVLPKRQEWIEIRNLDFCKKDSAIAFSVFIGGGHPNIWSVRIDGSNLKRLTYEGGDQPSWSPDGSRIVYTNTKFGEIWIMHSDGTNHRSLIGSKGR